METAGNWRKSSYSGANGGECVEAASLPDVVMVRDTQNRNGCVLTVPTSTWRAFVATVK
jgi:hypothetical protein